MKETKKQTNQKLENQDRLQGIAHTREDILANIEENEKNTQSSEEVKGFRKRMTNMISVREDNYLNQNPGFGEGKELQTGELFSRLFSIEFLKNEGIRKVLNEAKNKIFEVRNESRDKQKYLFKSIVTQLIGVIISQTRSEKDENKSQSLNSLGKSLVSLLSNIDNQEIKYIEDIDKVWLSSNNIDINTITFEEREMQVEKSLKSEIKKLFARNLITNIKNKQNEIIERADILMKNWNEKKNKLETNIASYDEGENNLKRKDEIHLEQINIQLERFKSFDIKNGDSLGDSKLQNLFKELEGAKTSTTIKLNTKEEKSLVPLYKKMNIREGTYTGLQMIEMMNINTDNREEAIEQMLSEFRKEQTILRAKLTDRKKVLSKNEQKRLLRKQYLLDFKEKYYSKVQELMTGNSKVFNKISDRVKNYFKYRGIKNISQDAVYMMFLGGVAFGGAMQIENIFNRISKNNIDNKLDDLTQAQLQDLQDTYNFHNGNISVDELIEQMDNEKFEATLEKDIEDNLLSKAADYVEDKFCDFLDLIPTDQLIASEIDLEEIGVDVNDDFTYADPPDPFMDTTDKAKEKTSTVIEGLFNKDETTEIFKNQINKYTFSGIDQLNVTIRNTKKQMQEEIENINAQYALLKPEFYDKEVTPLLDEVYGKYKKIIEDLEENFSNNIYENLQIEKDVDNIDSLEKLKKYIDSFDINTILDEIQFTDLTSEQKFAKWEALSLSKKNNKFNFRFINKL